MKESEFGKFKIHLLSSGIPLEVTVSNLLENKGWLILEEMPFYLKNDVTGGIERSTTEIIGRNFFNFSGTGLGDLKICFDIDVECKYRNPSTDWVFFGSNSVISFSNYIKNHDYFSTNIPAFSANIPTFWPRRDGNKEVEYKIYRKFVGVLKEYLENFNLASRAVQIEKDEFSRGTVTEALNQLMKSAIFWKNTNIATLPSISLCQTTSIIFPCLVTTSEMLYFENADVESIKELEHQDAGKKWKNIDKILFCYQIPKSLEFQIEFVGESIGYIFIPIFSHKIFISEIEKLRKMIEGIEL